MLLGTEVGLGPGHIVLDGDPAPPPKGAQPPIFGPCLLWPLKGHSPQFWTMSVVAKRLDGSRCHLVWWLASTQATLC